jgi:hypothetical protein
LESRVHHYNARHQFWPEDSVPDMPEIRRRAVALSLGFEKIVVVGGLQSSTSSDRFVFIKEILSFLNFKQGLERLDF